jgi:hypothetical protein
MPAMEVSLWFAQHWFDLLQTLGIVGGLFFTAYALRKDEKARRIGNSIAINEQHRKTWRVLFEHPELGRVLSKQVNLAKQPISPGEELFVTGLILHLNTVHQAMQHGEFIKLEGLRRDVDEFFALPIPKIIWTKIKRFQDRRFVEFIEASLK